MKNPSKSEFRYRRMFETAQEGILLIDSQTGMILDANEFLIDLLDYSKEDFLKKHLWNVGAFKDIAASKENFATLQKKKYVRFKNLPLETKTGKQINVEFIANAYQEDGTTIIQCNIRDITEQKQVEKNLENEKIAVRNVLEDLNAEKLATERAKAKDDAILASIGDGVITTDEQGKITMINKTAEKMLGRKPHEILGKPIYAILLLENEEGDTIPPEKLPVSIALAGTTTTVYYVREDKTKFPVSISVAPVILNEKIIGTVDVFRDVTKEKEIDKAKTEFVSLASHQLRTPLTAINWYIEMLQDGDTGALNDKQKKYLLQIYRGSQRMVKLIDDLLNVSHLETGRIKIEPVPTDLIAFIQDISKEFGPLAKEKGCQIQLELPKGEVEKINIDQILLRQVIANLLTNAIQYSSGGKAGQVKISLAVSPTGYTIYVTDNGICIPKEVQGHIFEKLFRADNAHEIIPDGTGLGLYLAKQIMESSGGTIGFTSENKVTTFYITIPISGMKLKQIEKN